VLRRPLAERGKLKYTFDEQKMGHVGKTEITTAAEMFEALVHPTFVQRSSNVFMQEMSFKIPPASNDHAVRGFYSSRENTVYITPGKNRGALYTVLHEITHSLEYADSDIARKTRDFLTRRANGEAPKRLSTLVKGSSYGISEVAYEDEFAKRGGDHYMGKEYGKKQHATEIVTMGIERLANDAASFRKQDKDYFDFIVRLLNDL